MMDSSTTCRAARMLARLNGVPEEYGERCHEAPTHRVLLRDETDGLRVEVLAEVCGEHCICVANTDVFVTSWVIRQPAFSRPGAHPLAADS